MNTSSHRQSVAGKLLIAISTAVGVVVVYMQVFVFSPFDKRIFVVKKSRFEQLIHIEGKRLSQWMLRKRSRLK